MENYFISRKKRSKTYTPVDAFIVNEQFAPIAYRVSHPIVLNAFIIGEENVFYEVLEGIYCVNGGTLKLKVKKQYGK